MLDSKSSLLTVEEKEEENKNNANDNKESYSNLNIRFANFSQLMKQKESSINLNGEFPNAFSLTAVEYGQEDVIEDQLLKKANSDASWQM